jgi:hypothetical protein
MEFWWSPPWSFGGVHGVYVESMKSPQSFGGVHGVLVHGVHIDSIWSPSGVNLEYMD